MIFVAFCKDSTRRICPAGEEQYLRCYGKVSYDEAVFVNTLEEAVSLDNPFGNYVNYNEKYTQSIYIVYRDDKECKDIMSALSLHHSKLWVNEANFKGFYLTHPTNERSRVTDWFTLSSESLLTA